MSLWDEGNLKHGRLNLPPRIQWSDSLCSNISQLSTGSTLWRSLFLSLFSLLVILTLTNGSAHAKDDGSGGEGLFALSLEEVLDIDVTVADHFAPSKEGVYALSSHELLRLYSQPGHIEVLTEELSGTGEQKGFPVLLRGNYLGTFKDIRSALRFVQQISNKELRVDLYIGSTTVWFEKGRYPVLLDIQDGVEPSLLETSTAMDRGALTHRILAPSETEVLP